MKITFITREGNTSPGAKVRCYNFSKELSLRGIQTEIISFKDTFGAPDGKEEHSLSLFQKIKYNYLTFLKLLEHKNSIIYLNRINYHSFAPFFFKLIYKNKLILDLDDWEIRENNKYYFNKFPASKAYLLTTIIARKSSACIASSTYLYDFLKKQNTKTFYIPSGVDTQLFQPKESFTKNDKIIFSWIGTMHKESNLLDLKFIIECFMEVNKYYSNIALEIIGDGLFLKELKQHLSHYQNKNIILSHWIQDINIYLQKIDVGLLPLTQLTKFNMSKSPVKLFEYMAMQIPTICSNIGQAKEVITHGQNGFLCDSKKDFIQTMELLIKTPALINKLGLEAKKTVSSKYALKILGQQLFEIITTL